MIVACPSLQPSDETKRSLRQRTSDEQTAVDSGRREYDDRRGGNVAPAALTQGAPRKPEREARRQQGGRGAGAEGEHDERALPSAAREERERKHGVYECARHETPREPERDAADKPGTREQRLQRRQHGTEELRAHTLQTRDTGRPQRERGNQHEPEDVGADIQHALERLQQRGIERRRAGGAEGRPERGVTKDATGVIRELTTDDERRREQRC